MFEEGGETWSDQHCLMQTHCEVLPRITRSDTGKTSPEAKSPKLRPSAGSFRLALGVDTAVAKDLPMDTIYHELRLAVTYCL